MVTFVVRVWTPPDDAGASGLRGMVELVGKGEGPRPFRTEGELLDVLRTARPTSPEAGADASDPADLP